MSDELPPPKHNPVEPSPGYNPSLNLPGHYPPPPPPLTPGGYGGYAQGPPPPAAPYSRGDQPTGPPNRFGSLAGIGAVGVLLKILLAGKFLTLITLGASFGLYSWRYGPLVAGGLVGMIFVHEMGHVLEIRRQGMKATAPIFIPFFGAAIFQNSHPTDALRQAQIGIAGPVAGTLGATAALVMFHATGYSWLAVWAGIGFGLNLFNMIPVGMLDGGWILAPVSKWSQVLGLVLLVGASLWIHFPIEYLLLILVIGFPALMSRFQNAGSDYYRSVPMGGRIAMAIAWIGLCAYLIWGVFYVLSIFGVSPF